MDVGDPLAGFRFSAGTGSTQRSYVVVKRFPASKLLSIITIIIVVVDDDDEASLMSRGPRRVPMFIIVMRIILK